MRKTVVLLFVLGCMAYVVACGGSKSSTSNVVIPVALPAPFVSYSAVVAGKIPRGALSFSNYSVSTFSGSSAGFSNYSRATSPVAKYNRPIGITATKDNIYVADHQNSAIRRIDIATRNDVTIASTLNGINLPRDITTDGTNLYVANSGDYTIRKIDSSGVVTILAGISGQPGYEDNVVGSSAKFNEINGITTDGSYLYVTDSSYTIRRILISSPSPVTTLAGEPGTSGSADGIGRAARFNLPNRITTDGPNLYVTDFYNNVIRKIVIATGAVTTIAGGKAVPAGSHRDSTDGTGNTALFNQPNGIITDGLSLYITDSFDNMIRKVVLSSSTVSSGPVTTIAGFNSGPTGGFNDGKGTVATFNKPIGIGTDGINLFIADNQNYRIRRIQ